MHFIAYAAHFQLTPPAGLFSNDDALLSLLYHMTPLRNESKIMLYDKKNADRYPAKDEENFSEASQ